MARKTKKTIIRTPKNVDEKYLGTEPILTGDVERIDIQLAWNWYNYFCDVDKAKKYILDWMKFRKFKKEQIDSVKSVDKNDIYRIGLATGWTARLLTRGSELPEKYVNLVNDRVNELVKKNDKVTISLDSGANTNRVSVQTHMYRQSCYLTSELEDLLYSKDELKPYEHFQSGGYSATVVKKTQDRWQSEYDEVAAAINKTDPQCVEAYAHMTKKELTVHLARLQTILDDIDRFTLNNKKVRKPRKSKPTPATKQVSKLNYQKEDKEFKLVSVDPINVIGAQELWVYNTKYRQLSYYETLGREGLSVKGSTLKGFNTETASTRKLRKPKETLGEILKASKTKAKKVMDSLTTKPTTPTGRINNDTILLKVIK